MNIYLLVKYNNIEEEIVEIYCNEEDIIELESRRNNYALTKKDGYRWRIEIINIKEW